MDHHMNHLKSKISSIEEDLAQKLFSLEMKVNSTRRQAPVIV